MQILTGGTQLVWQAKEKARTDRLHGEVIDDQTSRRSTRRRTRNQDIRVLYRRIAFKQAKEQAAESIRFDRGSLRSDILQTERTNAPINATRRLRRLNTTRVVKARRDTKLRWTMSLEQEWFSLTRAHSNEMLTLKTGKGPAHRRNLRTSTYHTAYDMDWLKEYDRRNLDASDHLTAVVVNSDAVVTTRDTVVVTRDTVVVTRDTVVVTIATIVVTKDSVVVTRDTVVTIRDTMIVTRDTVVSTRDAVVVTRDTVVVTRDSVVVTRDTIVTTRDTVVVTRDAVVVTRYTVVVTRDLERRKE